MPLAPPALLLIPAVFLVIPLLFGLGVAVLGSKVEAIRSAARSPVAITVGRLALGALALALLPDTVAAVTEVVRSG